MKDFTVEELIKIILFYKNKSSDLELAYLELQISNVKELQKQKEISDAELISHRKALLEQNHKDVLNFTKEIGKLLTNPKLLKGTALGTGAGLLATGTGNLMNEGFGFSGRMPKIDPNTGMPWYMRDGGSSSQAANTSVADPFELPPEIMARMRSESGAGQAGANMAGPIGDLSNKRNQLLQLENQISTLQSALPSNANPRSYAQRQTMQSQIDNLKMQRNQLAGNIGNLETQISTDKSNMFNSAMEAQRLSERGLSSARNEFDTLRRRQQIAQEGGVFGSLMGAYNNMTGLDRQLSELDPVYTGYENELEQARKLQELAR